MSRLSLIALALLGASLLTGCDAGTAAGGAHPANENFGPMNKPPGVAGAGGGGTGAAKGAPAATGAQ